MICACIGEGLLEKPIMLNWEANMLIWHRLCGVCGCQYVCLVSPVRVATWLSG